MSVPVLVLFHASNSCVIDCGSHIHAFDPSVFVVLMTESTADSSIRNPRHTQDRSRPTSRRTPRPGADQGRWRSGPPAGRAPAWRPGGC